MKFLTLIFAAYILALPCVACADISECTTTLQARVSQSSANNQNHQHEEEACNPFCNCICCGHVIAANIRFAKIVDECFIQTKKRLSFYHSISLPSDFYGNIWQPPKTS